MLNHIHYYNSTIVLGPLSLVWSGRKIYSASSYSISGPCLCFLKQNGTNGVTRLRAICRIYLLLSLSSSICEKKCELSEQGGPARGEMWSSSPGPRGESSVQIRLYSPQGDGGWGWRWDGGGGLGVTRSTASELLDQCCSQVMQTQYLPLITTRWLAVNSMHSRSVHHPL